MSTTEKTHQRHAYVETSIGRLLLVAAGAELTGCYFPQHRYPPDPATIGPEVDEATDPLFARAAAQLREYLAGERVDFDLPLPPTGDTFDERVWALLRNIPRGQTTTYGALAEHLGGRGLAQRVGQAVGHNPLSIIVPCHRVVGADGSLTGFAGGLDRKRTLLALEEPEGVRDQRLF